MSSEVRLVVVDDRGETVLAETLWRVNDARLARDLVVRMADRLRKGAGKKEMDTTRVAK